MVVLKRRWLVDKGERVRMEGVCQAAPFLVLERGKIYKHLRGGGNRPNWHAFDGTLVNKTTYLTLTNSRCETHGMNGETLHHRTLSGIK